MLPNRGSAPSCGLTRKNADALGVLAVVLDQQKKYSEADPFYRRAITLSPRSPALLNNYGNHLVVSGKPDEALKYLDRAGAPGSSTRSRTSRTALGGRSCR